MADSAALDRKTCDVNVTKTAPMWAVLVVVLYFFSGVAALAYEVLWARMLSLQFGISIFGVVITVAAFMLGLGAGSLAGARIPVRYSPLLMLAIIEFSVAVFALSTPSLFTSIESVISSSSALMSVDVWFGLQFLSALVVLFVPATALGLGFPLVLRILSKQPITLGLIYGLNAMGGVVGALIPLLLLPMLGLVMSLYIVASIGIVLAVAFFILSHQVRVVDEVTSQVKPSYSKLQSLPIVSLWMYSLIGAGSLVLQIGWTRLYGMLLLRTEYVMAIILAVFLLGMALGSLFLRSQRTTYWLTVLPMVVAFGAVLSLWGLPWVARVAASGEYGSLGAALLWQGLCIAIFTLPVTFALGAWLPVLSNYFKGDGNTIGAKFYGANAVGSAVGTLLAGLVLFEKFGTSAVVCLAAFILLAAGLYFSPVRKKALLSALPLVALAVPVWNLPAVNILLPTTLADTQDIYYHEDAVSITHVVEQSDGQRLLLGDLQRMDASSEPSAVVSQQNQARLPLLLHVSPRSVLFLGVGTGISVSGSLAYGNLKRVGVELSQGAIEASRNYFSLVNEKIVEQGSLLLIRDDARRYLKTTADSYDVIIGDLFHPDLVGRSALLSTEQFKRAKAHLNADGVFVQWLALNQFDYESLDVVLRTFASIFDDAHLYLDGFRLAMVGKEGAASDAPSLFANLGALDQKQQEFATGGEGGWTWLGRYFGPIEPTVGALQGELKPVIEYRLPRARYTGDMDLSSLLQILMERRPSVEESGRILKVSPDDFEKFERAYMAVELGARSWIASVEGRHGEAERLTRFAYSANPNDRWAGFNLADRMFATLDQAVASGYMKSAALLRILDIRPDHEEALREMVYLSKEAGDQRQVEYYYTKLKALSPLSQESKLE